MKLSTRLRFGTRIMMQVALSGSGKPVLSRDIAVAQDLTEAYAYQLLMHLRNGGLLTSQRGKRGGFLLARPASDITVLDIYEVLEGPLNLVDCLDGSDKCSRLSFCATRGVWADLNQAMAATMRRHRLDALAEREREGRRQAGSDYAI